MPAALDGMESLTTDTAFTQHASRGRFPSLECGTHRMEVNEGSQDAGGPFAQFRNFRLDGQQLLRRS